MLALSSWCLACLAPLAAGGVVLEPVAGEGQAPIVADGNTILTAEDGELRIAVALLHSGWLEPGGRAELVVYVVNRGPQAFEFGPTQVQVASPDGDLERIGAAELGDEIRGLARDARFELKLARSKDATSSLPTYFSGSLSSVGGANAPQPTRLAGYGGSNAKSARESASSRRTKASVREQREQIDAWEKQTLATIDALALKPTQVAPGGNVYGHLFVVLPRRIREPVPLTLEIEAGGKAYAFPLQVRPIVP